MKGRDDIAFVVFILSASAMDSEKLYIPMMCCICSLIYLWRVGKYGTDRKQNGR